MKFPGVQLTDRDMQIMKFINDCGFCEMPQIERRFGIKSQRSYRVIGRLIKARLVKHHVGFYRHHGAYTLTPSGARCTELPCLGKIPLGQYDHQIALTNVHIKLLKQFPSAEWISERQLKFDKFYDGLGRRGHLPDGLLVFPEDVKIAIEVEMSVKGKNRIGKILRSYAKQDSIKEVWYYCLPNVIAAISAESEKMPFIKIYNLLEYLR